MTDHLAIGDRVVLPLGFRASRDRLEVLASDEMLLRASEAAYGAGITHLVAAAGPAAGLTRLAGVHLDQLTGTAGCVHISLSWEAIAADGKLFTALWADLMMVPAGDQTTALALAGGFRPQPGPAGAGLDEAALRRCATVAIRSFVAEMARAISRPAGTAGPAVVL
jgi:hypothetical protein